jgi:hypothetical protein
VETLVKHAFQLFVACAMIACGVLAIGVTIVGPAIYLGHVIDNALAVVEVEINGAQSELPG